MYNHDYLDYNPVQMDTKTMDKTLLFDGRFEVLTERRFAENISTVLVTLMDNGRKVESLIEDCPCTLEDEQDAQLRLKQLLLIDYG